MQDNSKLSVLVIDPNPGMRGSLQNMLIQANITKIEFAVSSGTAGNRRRTDRTAPGA